MTSVYGQSFDGTLDRQMINKVMFDNVPEESVKDLAVPNFENVDEGFHTAFGRCNCGFGKTCRQV